MAGVEQSTTYEKTEMLKPMNKRKHKHEYEIQYLSMTFNLVILFNNINNGLVNELIIDAQLFRGTMFQRNGLNYFLTFGIKQLIVDDNSACLLHVCFSMNTWA